ncbi:MAG: P1 family peptidase [Acidimicrobiia bacterium]|nr:P1 family peptidase [Acidimicrobiia bacterium]MDH3470212.1 P1 family peptidase [Acidimicrobiia bacterium]
MTITDVPGVEVGHFTDDEALTGVTVITFPEPNIATAEVRGAAPGTREIALLQPGSRIENIQAIVLSGGSAFGLATADGVSRGLLADGKGHRTINDIIVPIVPTAILFDLMIGDAEAWPGPEEGAMAYDSANSGPVEMGNVGAGTGATVAGWRGMGAVRKGGLGSHSIRAGDAIVGAVVAVNAVGDVFTLEGESLTGGSPEPPINPNPPSQAELSNTTLVTVATNAKLSRTDLMRLTVRAHDAIGACVRPGHTRYDGDVAFAVSCGDVEADPDAVGEAAFISVARAIEWGVRSAESAGGVPAMDG